MCHDLSSWMPSLIGFHCLSWQIFREAKKANQVDKVLNEYTTCIKVTELSISVDSHLLFQSFSQFALHCSTPYQVWDYYYFCFNLKLSCLDCKLNKALGLSQCVILFKFFPVSLLRGHKPDGGHYLLRGRWQNEWRNQFLRRPLSVSSHSTPICCHRWYIIEENPFCSFKGVLLWLVYPTPTFALLSWRRKWTTSMQLWWVMTENHKAVSHYDSWCGNTPPLESIMKSL